MKDNLVTQTSPFPENTFSQFGEDPLLAKYFSGRKSGVCVEVGANDGVNGSTTYFFERLGWQCVLIEPNVKLCDEMARFRKGQIFPYAASNRTGSATLHVVEGGKHSDGLSTINAKALNHDLMRSHGFTSSELNVRTETLDNLLVSARISQAIDFISIDVEGHELEVLQGLSLNRWKPRFLLIEDNSNFVDRIIPDYMKARGYRRFKRTGVNDWYAHESDTEALTVRNLITFRFFQTRAKLRRELRKSALLLSIYRRLRSLS